jgi:hypothetical protein
MGPLTSVSRHHGKSMASASLPLSGTTWCMDLRFVVADDGVTNICIRPESTVRGRVSTGAVGGITGVTSVLQVKSTGSLYHPRMVLLSGLMQASPSKYKVPSSLQSKTSSTFSLAHRHRSPHSFNTYATLTLTRLAKVSNNSLLFDFHGYVPTRSNRQTRCSVYVRRRRYLDNACK